MDSNTWILVIVAIIVLIIIMFIAISNGLNKSIIKIDEASSDIDVALTKRYDVLTKMIDTVKSATKYEQETIFKTVELRQGMTIQEKSEADAIMQENLDKINLLVENYPDLKASENFMMLQKSIADVEEHLQAARRLYNSNVSSYNQKIVTFPSSIVAGMKGLTKKEFFKADEEKLQDVKIDI